MLTSKLDKTSVASGGISGASATELYERVLSAGPDTTAKLAWHSSIAKEGALNASQAMLDLKEIAQNDRGTPLRQPWPRSSGKVPTKLKTSSPVSVGVLSSDAKYSLGQH